MINNDALSEASNGWIDGVRDADWLPVSFLKFSFRKKAKFKALSVRQEGNTHTLAHTNTMKDKND